MSGTKKPSHEEDEFFAKEEATRLHNLAMERARKMQVEERERLKQLHFMHCPKCGFELQTDQVQGARRRQVLPLQRHLARCRRARGAGGQGVGLPAPHRRRLPALVA